MPLTHRGPYDPSSFEPSARQVDRVLGATVIAAGIYCHPSPFEASVAEGVLESS